MGDAAQCDNRAQIVHFGDCGFQIIAAGRDLLRGGFVIRRNAAHGIGDPAIEQLESVVGAGGVTTVRKAEFSQSRVKEVAGIVASEWPPGAVGAAQPGARPTIKSRASLDPNESTGALNQSGSLWRHDWRNATSRGQRGQSRPGIPLGRILIRLRIRLRLRRVEPWGCAVEIAGCASARAVRVGLAAPAAGDRSDRGQSWIVVR